MALAITSGYTVSAGEVWTPTKHNQSTVPVITLAQGEIMARQTVGTGSVEALTVAQLRTLLGLGVADSPTFAGLDSPIGQVTPRAGNFTALGASDDITLSGGASGKLIKWSTNDTNAVRLYTFSNTYGIGTDSSDFVAFTNSGFRVRGGGSVAGTEYIRVTSTGLTTTAGSFSDTTDASSTTVGSLKTAGGLAVAKGAYFGNQINAPVFNVTSARRFKKNIHRLAGVAQLLHLRPVWYDDKRADGRKNLVGFIAEEVQKVLPSMVAKDANGRVLALNYSQLVALAIAGIQNQEKRLAKLERKAA